MANHKKVFGVCENKCFVEVALKPVMWEQWTSSQIAAGEKKYFSIDIAEQLPEGWSDGNIFMVDWQVKVGSTQQYCNESKWVKMFHECKGYYSSQDGTFTIELKNGGGAALYFRPRVLLMMSPNEFA